MEENKNLTNEELEKMKDVAKDIFNATTSEDKSPNIVEMTLPELLKQEVDSYKNLYLRTLADYQNLRKRTDNEFTKGWYNGQNKLIEELLPFFDDFERMLDYEVDYKGASLVYSSLKNILNLNNISVINPQEGEVFQEQFHDAVMTVPTDDKKLDNHIKATFAKGYKHNDYIIRYATVSVYKYTEP